MTMSNLLRKGSPDAGNGLREIIDTACPSDSEFEAFCIDYFPEIHRQFGCTQDHVQKLNLLLSSTSQNRLIESLRKKYPNIQIKQTPHSSRIHRKKILLPTFLILAILTAVCLVIAGFQKFDAIIETSAIKFTVIDNNTTNSARRIISIREFPTIIEDSIAKTIGAKNLVSNISKYYDDELKREMIYVDFIDRRTGKSVSSLHIPADDIRAWISNISPWHPFAKEVAIEISRLLAAPANRHHPTASKRLATTGEPIVSTSNSELSLSVIPLPTQSSSTFSAKNDGLHPKFPNPNHVISGYDIDLLAHKDMGLAYDIISDSGVNDSDDGLDNDVTYMKTIPMALMANELLYKEVPRLPEETKKSYLCTTFTVSHKICVDTNGHVQSIESVRSIDTADSHMKKILLKWKFKPRLEPVCFINYMDYAVDDGLGCDKVKVEIPENGGTSNEGTINNKSVQPKMVPTILIKKEKISIEDDPHLPDRVKNKNRGRVITASYRVCISFGGAVSMVEPLDSLDKKLNMDHVDDFIMTYIHKWRYKPQSTEKCFNQFIEWHIE